MIKKKFNNKNNCLKLCALFMFPFALFGGIGLCHVNKTSQAAEKYVRYYNEKVSVTNSNFTQGATPYAQGNSLSGWNAIETESKATGMLIDVGKGSNTEEGNTDTTIFSTNKERYMLSLNPGSHGEDSRILMINSKEKSTQKNIKAYKGYKSSDITLEANSYYVFSVSAKALLNDDAFVNGSIYINGLKDKDDKDLLLGYENFTNSVWKEYYFFIATGSASQTVNIELYLGTKGGVRSEGAVFFDNVNISRHSQNGFMELVHDYNYKNKDNTLINLTSSNANDSIFLLEEYSPSSALIEGDYNFDFEDELTSAALGEHWKIIPGAKDNGNAQIIDIRNIQQRDFHDLTGRDYIGDNLSYQNNQALVLWTNNGGYSSNGYVGVKSEDILIEAHGTYKVSLQMKVAEMEGDGAFYLQVKENDYIYSTYSSYLSSNSDDKNYYELKSGKTSGITSNVTNAWTNDYQTVELYIKGHSLYKTNVNIELWLGDKETAANGCVVIDDIKIERVDNSSFSSASNQLELKVTENNTDTINNGNFNAAETNTSDGKYPLTATGWTVAQENDKYSESGIIYLAGNEEYNRLYKGKYVWAGINPNSHTNIPNNVYMMFNNHNSYQSITSSDYSVTTNGYYKISFDYYNQLYGSLNDSKILVEIIDENNITLFSKTVSSLDAWQNMEIYLHTAKNVSHNIKARINLGTEKDKVGGMVYLDNFNIETVTEDVFAAITNNKVELDNYYLNLVEATNTITSHPAYEFKVDAQYDNSTSSSDNGTIGGIVSGKDNDYGISNEENLLVIKNDMACSSSLKTNYKLSLEADKYYELTFDLATRFGSNAGKDSKEHKCEYGVKVTIDGYEAIEKIISTEELQTYKIYYHSTASSTPQITFSLISDCDNTTGTAIITNLNFVETNEYTFANISNDNSFDKTIFKANVSEATDNEEPDDSTSDDKDTESNSNLWLLIPSIIMAVALIVAVVGILLRKVKIKKIEKIKKEAYDKKLRTNNDALVLEAQKLRDSEVKDIQTAIDRLKADKQKLEEEHKIYVKDQSEKTNGKLSKDVEKAFKKYNSEASRIDEKINILSEKVKYCMSADYLLTLQRKILIEKDEQEMLEKRIRKKEAKKAKKN